MYAKFSKLITLILTALMIGFTPIQAATAASTDTCADFIAIGHTPNWDNAPIVVNYLRTIRAVADMAAAEHPLLAKPLKEKDIDLVLYLAAACKFDPNATIEDAIVAILQAKGH